jgi:hypothetical protein
MFMCQKNETTHTHTQWLLLLRYVRTLPSLVVFQFLILAFLILGLDYIYPFDFFLYFLIFQHSSSYIERDYSGGLFQIKLIPTIIFRIII